MHAHPCERCSHINRHTKRAIYEHSGATAAHTVTSTHWCTGTQQCTDTIIWLNMLQNIACWFSSDIFITLHLLLVFNAILLPRLLLSISGNAAHFLPSVWLCACVWKRALQHRDETHFTYLCATVKRSCEQQLVPTVVVSTVAVFSAMATLSVPLIPLPFLYLHHTSENVI